MERQTKEKQAEIDKLLTKVAKLEDERDTLQESENLLSEKVRSAHLSPHQRYSIEGHVYEASYIPWEKHNSVKEIGEPALQLCIAYYYSLQSLVNSQKHVNIP